MEEFAELGNDEMITDSSTNDCHEPLLLNDSSEDSGEFVRINNEVSNSTLPNSSLQVLTKNKEERVTTKTLKIVVLILILVCTVLLAALLCVVLPHMAEFTNKTKRESDIISKDVFYFFQVSDTHLDLFYKANISSKDHQMCRNAFAVNKTGILYSKTTATYGRVKCDSPERLLESAVKHMKDVNTELKEKVEFVLITGDQSAHDYDYFDIDEKDNTVWSIGNSTKFFSQISHDIPVFPAIGNNDLYLDYQPPVNNKSDLYKRISTIIERYIFLNNHPVSADNTIEDFRKTFNFGGYYSILFKAREIMLVVLNTNYWLSEAYSLNMLVTSIGDKQMQWLNRQLEIAKQKNLKVIIAGHVPPGCNVYADSALWLRNYTSSYLQIIAIYSDLISAQLFAHLHSDKFRMLYANDEFPLKPTKGNFKSSILIAPSITPIYQSNPAFRLYSMYAKNKRLQNYLQYYMDLTVSNIIDTPTWKKEYSFQEVYNTTFLSSDIDNLVEQLRDPSADTWSKYMQHIKTSYGGVLSSQRYHEYCVAKHVHIQAYNECLTFYQNTGNNSS